MLKGGYYTEGKLDNKKHFNPERCVNAMKLSHSKSHSMREKKDLLGLLL